MKMLFGILLVAMLLIAGCPGGAPQGGAQPGGPSAGQPSGTAPSQPGGMPGTAPSGQETQQGSNPFESWDMQAMMAMGQPVHCTVTTQMEGTTSTAEMWFKGENMRIESTSSSAGEFYTSTVVMKNEVMYMSQQEGYGMEGMEDCDWQLLDSKKLEACMPESEEPSDAGTFDMETYETTPYEYHCEYAAFGDEKFATPGKVCDLTQQLCDMYEMMESGTFPGMGTDMCEGLTGQDYTDCVEAVSQHYK